MTLLSVYKPAAAELCNTFMVMMLTKCYSMHLKDRKQDEVQQMHAWISAAF